MLDGFFRRSVPHVSFRGGLHEIAEGTFSQRKPARRGFFDVLFELLGFGRKKPPMQPQGPQMEPAHEQQ